MSTAGNVEYWIMTVHNTNSETVTRGFWAKFVADVNDYVAGLNTYRSETILSIEIEGHSLVISYGHHDLTVLFDIRTGTLSYWFHTPLLRRFEKDGTGVTKQGTVQIDKYSGAFRTSSEPPINLGKSSFDAAQWPAHDRLAQYLLQQLLVPEHPDERFVAAAN